VDHPVRDGHAPSLFTLLEGCLESGGYVEEPGGRVTGLLYRPFADFTGEHYQLQADVITDLCPDRVIRELGQDRPRRQASPRCRCRSWTVSQPTAG
jgi:hypothetical protein